MDRVFGVCVVDRMLDKIKRSGVRCPWLVMSKGVGQTSLSKLHLTAVMGTSWNEKQN